MNPKIIIPTLIKRTRIFIRGLRMKADPRRKIVGSAAWLVATEIKYGGRVIRVPRKTVSPLDPRSKEQIAYRGMSGGDRMLYNGYAEKYAEFLRPFIQSGKAHVVVEVGILTGTGLAIWCELFPKATVWGLDIDPSHFRKNEQNLIERGAFQHTRPSIHTFDQFVHNGPLIEKLLDGQKIDICIDDGFHSNETIMNTFEDMVPFLANDFVYFIEDNGQVHEPLQRAWPDLVIESAGLLTIVTRGPKKSA
jgi:hypothetical protein